MYLHSSNHRGSILCQQHEDSRYQAVCWYYNGTSSLLVLQWYEQLAGITMVRAACWYYNGTSSVLVLQWYNVILLFNLMRLSLEWQQYLKYLVSPVHMAFETMSGTVSTILIQMLSPIILCIDWDNGSYKAGNCLQSADISFHMDHLLNLNYCILMSILVTKEQKSTHIQHKLITAGPQHFYSRI